MVAVRLGSGVREPAVAGRFYPGRAAKLAAEVDHHLALGRAGLSGRANRPVAVVAPHAGYVYSGPTAGYAYGVLEPEGWRRVVVIGPAHYVAVAGVGLSSARSWATPLGEQRLDVDAELELATTFDLVPADAAHAPEHSLEVQLPFLQQALAPGWQLVPLIVGRAGSAEVAAIIGHAAAWPATLVVISTDLSHYLSYDAARRVDAATRARISAADPAGISDSDACGAYGLRGLLAAARSGGWAMVELDARNSGDTAGDRGRVVGYCAFAAYRPDEAGSPPQDVVAAAPSPADRPDEGPGPSADAHAAPEDPGQSQRDAGGIGPRLQAALLALARATIMSHLQRQAAPDWRAVAQAHPEAEEPGAAFVTLRTNDGQLLGCIGSLEPRAPLARDVADHAYDAAFRDPRFPAMTAARARDMVIDISVLGPTQPFPVGGYAELVSALAPGTGLVVEAGRHRATFLPAVWETLPDAASFIAALWRKAGLAPGAWPRGIAISRYDVQEFAES